MSETTSRLVEDSEKGVYFTLGDWRIPITEAVEVGPLTRYLTRAADKYKRIFPTIPFPDIEPVGLVQAFSVERDTKFPAPQVKGEVVNEAALALLARYTLLSEPDKPHSWRPYQLLKGTILKQPAVRQSAKNLITVLGRRHLIPETMNMIMNAVVQGESDKLRQTYENIREEDGINVPPYAAMEQRGYASGYPNAVVIVGTFAEALPPNEVRIYLGPSMASLPLLVLAVSNPILAITPMAMAAFSGITLPERLFHEVGHLLAKTKFDEDGNITRNGLSYVVGQVHGS